MIKSFEIKNGFYLERPTQLIGNNGPQLNRFIQLKLLHKKAGLKDCLLCFKKCFFSFSF